MRHNAFAGRRVLVVARDLAGGDLAEAQLREAGLEVERLHGERPVELDRDGRIAEGRILVLDGDNFDAMTSARHHAMKDTMDAVKTMIVGAGHPASDDLVLMITPEQAMLDSVELLERLAHREGGIFDRLFGEETIARERRALSTYRLDFDDRMHVAHCARIPTTARGSDNDRWNQRQSRTKHANRASNRRAKVRGHRG